jgi:hypothetical protein
LTVKGGDQLEDYPINFIKSYLWGRYIRKREKTYNPVHLINEFPYRLFTCDVAIKKKYFMLLILFLVLIGMVFTAGHAGRKEQGQRKELILVLILMFLMVRILSNGWIFLIL